MQRLADKLYASVVDELFVDPFLLDMALVHVGMHRVPSAARAVALYRLVKSASTRATRLALQRFRSARAAYVLEDRINRWTTQRDWRRLVYAFVCAAIFGWWQSGIRDPYSHMFERVPTGYRDTLF